MKKYIIISLISLLPLLVYSQRTIQMEYSDGIYKIPCVVNGANMKMIFDTGASVVSISLATAVFLYQNGYITERDFKEIGQSSTASGEIVDHMKINIRDIEIGGMHLYNVEGVVMESLNAPLLLGQSAIQKLGSITIKGNQLIINNATPVRKTYAKGEIFKYYDYNIKTSQLIMELDANLYEYVYAQRWQKTIEEIKTLIWHINKGNILSMNNGALQSEGTEVGVHINYMMSDKKRSTYIMEGAYYIGQIAKKMVDRGQYIK